MLKATKPRLFPLHLAPIDEFFLLDDRPDYPMTFASHIFLSGEICQESFLTSVEEALELHPLLRAHVRPAKQDKLCFVQSQEAFPNIDWGDIDSPIEFTQGESIDLTDEVGLRIWVRSGDGRTELVLQFHHACCDGTGAHRFIGDLLACYGQRTTTVGKLPQTAEYDSQLVKRRRAKLTDAISASRFTVWRRGLGQAFGIFGRKIAPLALSDQNSATANREMTFPGVVSLRFDRNQHQQLRDSARQMGGMLNDLLMAEMFQTMMAWNVSQGDKRRQHLRIMMPSDMRDKQDFYMPAANMTSYNFVTRHSNACRDSAQLLRSIRDETAAIKHEQRGRRFMDSILGAKHVPGLMPMLLSARRCLSTVTLSNMGDPTRRFLATFPRKGGKLVAGNLTLDHMVGVSPLRPQTRAAISIVSIYRELHINVRCDPHLMSVDDARAFLDLYGSRLSWNLGRESESVSASARPEFASVR